MSCVCCILVEHVVRLLVRIIKVLVYVSFCVLCVSRAFCCVAACCMRKREKKTFVFSFLGAINKMCTHRAGKIELVGLRLGLSACWFAACVVFNFVCMCSGDRYFLSWPRGGICFASLFASFLLWGVIKKIYSCASDHTLCVRVLV